MAKIRMGRAIGDAYDLTFGRYAAVFGVIWLPMLALAAAEYFTFAPVLSSMPDAMQYALAHPDDPSGPAQFNQLNGTMYLFNLIVLVFSIWMRVGVTKLALDMPRGPKFAYFFSGLDELRVIAGYFVYFALYLGAVIGVAIAVGIIIFVVAALYGAGVFAPIDPGLLKGLAIGAAVLGFVAAFGAAIYLQTRLLYLLVPATVSEKRFGLWESWELSRGNFWRIVVVAIGTLSPLILFEMILFIFIYIPIFVIVIAMMQQHPELAHKPELVGPFFAATFTRVVVTYGPIGAIPALFITPFFSGLSYAPPAYAYRTIAEGKG